MWKYIKPHIPNAITCCNLLSGCVAIVMAFNFNVVYGPLSGYQMAFIFIAAAAVFDFADGAMARLLKAYSNVGKELDSLADLVSFGVAPAMLVGNCIAESGGWPWLQWAPLFIAAMGALRLARFNVDDRQTTTFIGLPIPANAIFWIGFVASCTSRGYLGNVTSLAAIICVSLLMVSSMRMFSLKFKNFAWRENFRRYALIAGAILFVATSGLEGLVWTIILYVVMSAVTARVNPSTF